MKTKSYFKLIVLAVMAVAAMCPQWAQAQFSGSGSGTENDPYLIFNPIQLNEVRNYLGNSNVWFKMMYDIDLEEWLADNNPSQGWQPIGNSSSKFKGHFLGMGHRISGFFINRSSTDYVGFFGFTDGAVISDLTIEGETVKGNGYVGTLVGYANNTTVTYCHASIDVSSSSSVVGGLLGYENQGSCSNSSYEGDVSCGDYQAGGLIGEAVSSTITDCEVLSSVTAVNNDVSLGVGKAHGITITSFKGKGYITSEKNYVGGVIGYTFENASTITNCIIDAKVSGVESVAGIVGKAEAPLTITSTRFVGEVMASGNYSGGLVGYSEGGGLIIMNCYAIADVSGLSYTGGLVGKAFHSGIITNTIETTSSKNYSVGNSTAFEGYTIVKKEQYAYWGDDQATHYAYRYKLVETATLPFNQKLYNNYYNGIVSGSSYVGGLVGSSNYHEIKYSYSYGSVIGIDNVGGLVGELLDINCTILQYSKTVNCILKSNVAIVETVNATNSNVGRIYGIIENPKIGACGTAEENKGLATAKVTLNGLQQELPDNLQHGTNVASATLKLRSTYQGIGWDFSNWQILETESYPYKANQCAPPVMNELVAGATEVSGQSFNGGTVYITIGDAEYSAVTSANVWSITVPPLLPGDIVKAYAVSDELEHSYVNKQKVGFRGKGTQAEPYEIYNARDLSNINSYSFYKLMNDIDLTEWIQANSPTEGWVPIGLYGGGSMRQLDGDGYIITGLWSNTTADFTGLIASTQDATICNLSVFTADGKSLKGCNNTGVVVGKAVNTTFSNVTVNGNVQGSDFTGGIAGYCVGNTYSNCRMTGSVSGHNYVGGISSGYGNGSSYEEVVFDGTVTGNDYVGGLSGNSTEVMTSSVVRGTVVGHDYVGGLAAMSSGIISTSYADGTVTGNNYVGGLVGESSSEINECYTAGTVSAINNKACYAGGVVGMNNGSIVDCYSSANVNSGVVDGSVTSNELQQYAGGIAGYNYGVVTRCYASGDLFAMKFGAGIVGYNDGENATTSNCFAINYHIDVFNETGIALRVIGGLKNNAPTPAADNYALKTMVVSINNVTQTIYDDLLHGISRPMNVLKEASTFSDNGWDMENVWGIDEGESFPYLLALVESDPEPGVLLGDVNGDANINVIDYVTTASYILERYPQPFIFDAADIDKNGTITVNDLVGVASIILSFEAPRLNAPVLGQIDNTSIDMSALICQNENDGQVITISLDNSVDITALQMDITLPQGMTLADASITSRASRSHQIEMEQLRDGTYRLIAASNACKAFKGNDGALLKLTLCGNVPGEVTFTNIELSTPSAQAFTHDDIHLSFGVTSLNSIETDTHIYKEGDNIVILSSIDGSAQVVLPNGISKILKVHAGCNVYPAPVSGVVIVRMDSKAVKLIF